VVPLSWMVIGAVLSQPAVAAGIDERVSGDPSLRPRVEARTRLIYDAASKSDSPRTFLLKTDNVLGVADAVGIEATGVSAGSAGARLVATVWSTQGKYAVEYYRSQEGRLLFVYETFVFFADRAPAGAWRNFMGLPAWERRSYFEDGGSIGYAVSLGKQAPAPGSGAAELHATCERLAKALGQR
jgi:hypothetical protein